MTGAEAISTSASGTRGRSDTGWPYIWLLLFLLGTLLALTWLVYFGPVVPYAVYAPELDEIINTAAVVIAGSVAVRSWVRYHETAELDSLLYSSAFLILFMDGLLRIVLQTSGSTLYELFAPDQPGQAPLYGWTARRILAAGLLLAGVLATGRRQRLGRTSMLAILFVPAVLAVVFSVLALSNEARLPALVAPEALRVVLQPGQSFDLAWVSPSLLVSQIVAGLLFAAGAVVAIRTPTFRARRGYILLIAAALIIAAVGQVHYGLVPGVYRDLLPSGDMLRLAFYLIALAAVAVASSEDLVQLREANRELHLLRASEAERATSLERARIAREIHDGMAQELWLARLTAGSLGDAQLPPNARATVERLDTILERALGEARQAIVTLQPSADERFGHLLTRYVDDYADHFGMEIECAVDTERSPTPDQQADLLRICREALSNARRHADATRVRVTFEIHGEEFVLSIADNGHGFDPDHTRSGFGFESMRQRAANLGGRLEIESAPLDGARVSVHLPLLGDRAR